MDIVERVARAMLADELKGGIRDFDNVWADEAPAWLSNARVAIEALREPSEAMLDQSGWTVERQMTPDDDAQVREERGSVAALWSAMIDAALTPPLPLEGV